MKTLIVWVWAFWFAVLNHLSKNHKNTTFYAVEKDENTIKYLKEKRQSPYFFPEVTLWKNIEFFSSQEVNYKDFDLIIIAIPAQFVGDFLLWIKDNLKSWVTFLNLAKWIDNKNLCTIWDIFKNVLWEFSYNYAVLSGWMIALDLVLEKKLWATIACKNNLISKKLKKLFAWKTLEISLSKSVKNVEISGAIKNVISLYIWYLEKTWNDFSSIWYYLTEILKETKYLFLALNWEKNIKFIDFAFLWDIIATCFWESRNRYFWNLVWTWKTSFESYEILKSEKKHAEWFETLKWLKEIILKDKRLKEYKNIVKIFLD